MFGVVGCETEKREHASNSTPLALCFSSKKFFKHLMWSSQRLRVCFQLVTYNLISLMFYLSKLIIYYLTNKYWKWIIGIEEENTMWAVFAICQYIRDGFRLCYLQMMWSWELLPQVEEFKYLRVLFTSEGKMEHTLPDYHNHNPTTVAAVTPLLWYVGKLAECVCAGYLPPQPCSLCPCLIVTCFHNFCSLFLFLNHVSITMWLHVHKRQNVPSLLFLLTSLLALLCTKPLSNFSILCTRLCHHMVVHMHPFPHQGQAL